MNSAEAQIPEDPTKPYYLLGFEDCQLGRRATYFLKGVSYYEHSTTGIRHLLWGSAEQIEARHYIDGYNAAERDLEARRTETADARITREAAEDERTARDLAGEA